MSTPPWSGSDIREPPITLSVSWSPDRWMAPGALLCFGVHGGLEAGRQLMEQVKIPTLAVSLGGVETLIEHPASMTHAGLSGEARRQAGITDNLIRLSVGCEDAEDLLGDLQEALNALSTREAAAAGVDRV
jgi:cystathionine beta-lyase/cystathionine gamma-synthase